MDDSKRKKELSAFAGAMAAYLMDKFGFKVISIEPNFWVGIFVWTVILLLLGYALFNFLDFDVKAKLKAVGIFVVCSIIILIIPFIKQWKADHQAKAPKPAPAANLEEQSKEVPKPASPKKYGFNPSKTIFLIDDQIASMDAVIEIGQSSYPIQSTSDNDTFPANISVYIPGAELSSGPTIYFNNRLIYKSTDAKRIDIIRPYNCSGHEVIGQIVCQSLTQKRDKIIRSFKVVCR